MNLKEENNIRVVNFYQKNSKIMLNYATSLTRNMNDAEDIIQDMIIEILEKQNKKIWDGKDSLSKNYIMMMVKCRVFNFKDKQKIRVESDLDDNEFVEDIQYDYINDSIQEQMLNAYIETVNQTKELHIDKYAAYYIKVRLYKMKMSQAIEISGVYRNTLYKHFKIMDEWVQDKFQQKKDLILNSLL